jgi:tRNA(fMet)-specific endonuclease VapC
MEHISTAPVVVVPTVVVGELVAAFESGSRARENHLTLGEFLDEPFVITADVTRAVSTRYGRVFAALRRAGTPIPVNDIWVAATTLALDGHLLTFDGDFRHVRGLQATILQAPSR